MTNYNSSTNRARTKALQDRSFKQTCNIIKSYPAGKPISEPSRITWRDLLKAANSMTFNLEEADCASSDADFLAKMRISLRESKEAYAAIRIIVECHLAGYEAVGKFEG